MATKQQPDEQTGELPGTLGRLLVMAVLAAMLGVGVASWLDRGTMQPLTATLQTRGVQMAAGREARVAEVLIKPGDAVTPGQPLLILTDERLELRRIAKEREIRELTAEFQRVQAAAQMEVEWRRRDLQAEIFQMQLKSSMCLQEKLTREVEQIAWQERLTGGTTRTADASVVAPLILDDDTRFEALLKEDAAAAAAESLETQYNLCERRLEQLFQLEKSLAARVEASAGVRLAETRLEQAREELAALDVQTKGLTITSKSYGTVGNHVPQVGDLVQPGHPLVELLDQDQPFLIARVPTARLSQLRLGDTVTVLFPNEENYQGTVDKVPLKTAEGTSPEARETPVEIQILPKGQRWPRLPIGSRAYIEYAPNPKSAAHEG